MRELDKDKEAPQQQRLHWKLGGTMIRELPAVPKLDGGKRGPRWIDSVVIPGVERVALTGRVTDYVYCRRGLESRQADLETLWGVMREHSVVCVQAKRKRLGPRLLGQALFSRGLLEAQGVTVLRTIASCCATHPELAAIAAELGVEVIVDPEVGAGPEPFLLTPHPAREAYLKSLEAGGASVHRGFPRSSPKGLQVEALVVRGARPAGPLTGWADLEGLDVTVVATTDQRACMYSLGVGVFMRAVAEHHGANAEAVVIAKAGDSALQELLAHHPGVRVELIPVPVNVELRDLPTGGLQGSSAEGF